MPSEGQSKPQPHIHVWRCDVCYERAGSEAGLREADPSKPEDRAAQIDKLLCTLDELARENDGWDYGLPIWNDTMRPRMVDAVNEFLGTASSGIRDAALEEAAKLCADYENHGEGWYGHDETGWWNAGQRLAASIRALKGKP
jgi:hypothetical protein